MLTDSMIFLEGFRNPHSDLQVFHLQFLTNPYAVYDKSHSVSDKSKTSYNTSTHRLGQIITSNSIKTVCSFGKIHMNLITNPYIVSGRSRWVHKQVMINSYPTSDLSILGIIKPTPSI